jgi:hypothetical protein
VVTVDQLRAAAVCPRFAERCVQRREWQRPARGVYVLHNRALTPWELALVATAYVGGRGLVTGLIPLHLLRLPWLPDVATAHVLVPEHVRCSSSGRVRVSRVTHWGAVDAWSMSGVRLASAERAVVDAARAAPSLREVRGIVLGAVRQRKAEVAQLRTVLDGGRRNGSALVRRALVDAERGCASPPEGELVDDLVGLGVPFLVNPEFWIDGVLLGSPDVWIVGTAVTGEVESVERHGEDEQQTATYDRHERFVAAGFEPVHPSVPRIRRPGVEAASYLLARARACPKPVPAGLVVKPRGPELH